MIPVNEGKSEMDRMEETLIETLMVGIRWLAFDSGDYWSGETSALTGSCWLSSRAWIAGSTEIDVRHQQWARGSATTLTLPGPQYSTLGVLCLVSWIEQMKLFTYNNKWKVYFIQNKWLLISFLSVIRKDETHGWYMMHVETPAPPPPAPTFQNTSNIITFVSRTINIIADLVFNTPYPTNMKNPLSAHVLLVRPTFECLCSSSVMWKRHISTQTVKVCILLIVQL